MPSRRHALLLAGASFAALALAGCQSAPPPRLTFAELRFNNTPPIIFMAERMEVKDEYVAPMKSPFVEHEAPVSPSRALASWAKDHLAYDASAPKSVRVLIREASLRETPLAVTQGFRGAFTNDQAWNYEGTVDVEISLHNDRGFREASASARMQRTRTLPEKASINDRDKLMYELVETLMRDFSAEMDRNIRQYMPLNVR